MAEEKPYTLDLPEGFLGDTFADSDGPKASSTIQPRIQRIADGTISINDFLSSAIDRLDKEGKEEGKKRILTLSKTLNTILKQYGKAQDTKLDIDNVAWRDLSTESTVKMLLDHKKTSSATFDTIGYAENLVAAYYTANKGSFQIKDPYPFSKIGNEDGIARTFGPKESNPKAYPIRGSAALAAVPRASITIPKVIAAIQAIKDKAVKAAVTIKMLVPFRNTEIWGKSEASLKVGDIDFEEGFARSFTRGKKTRPSIRFGTLALEIIKDAADESISEKAKELNISVEELKNNPKYKTDLKNTFIFPTVTDAKVKNGLMIEGQLAEKFAENEPLMGRLIKGVSDFRKLFPSLLAKALGADSGTVSKILGHGEDINLAGNLESMTTTFYVSEVDDPDFDPKRKAYDTLEHMIARETGATTLNELAANLDVGASRLTAENAPAYEVPDKPTSPVRIQAEQTPEQKEAVAAKARESKARSDRNVAAFELETAQLETQKITEQQKVTPEARRDAEAKKIKDDFETRKLDLKDYNELLEKQKTGTLSELDEYRLERLGKKLKVKPEAPEVVSSFTESAEDALKRYLNPENKTPSQTLREILLSGGKKTIKALPYMVTGGVGLAAKTAEAAVDVALTPSVAGDRIQDDPSSFEDEQLLQAMQSGARTADLTPVSDIAAREARTRLDTLLPKAEKADQKGRARRARIMARDRARKLETGLQNRATDLEEEYQGFALKRNEIADEGEGLRIRITPGPNPGSAL